MTGISAGTNDLRPIAGQVTLTDPALHENFLQPVDVICRADSSEYHVHMQYLVTPHCIVYKETFRFGITATGALPSPYYALCIPLHLTGDAAFGRQHFLPNTIALSDGGALHTVVTPGQRHVTLLIQKAFIRRSLPEAALLQLEKCARNLQIVTANPKVDAFGSWLSRLLQLNPLWDTNNPGAVLQQIEDDIVSCLGLFLDDTRPGRSSPSKRINALSRAMRRLNETDSNVRISIHDLYRAASVSQRTLERAFVDNFQQSAREFLLKRRLHNVRRLLLGNEKDGLLVKEAALSCGFYDLGRFSQYYKKLFHEAPSETLSRPAIRLPPHTSSLYVLQQTVR